MSAKTFIVGGLSYAGVNPNNAVSVTVTAITDPVGNDPLSLLITPVLFDDLPSWAIDAIWVLKHEVGFWRLEKIASAYLSIATTDANSPFGLIFGEPSLGAGQPTLTPVYLTGTHAGQPCKASTAWWKWTGSAWIPTRLLTGEVISYSATTDSYFYLSADADGALVRTDFPT